MAGSDDVNLRLTVLLDGVWGIGYHKTDVLENMIRSIAHFLAGYKVRISEWVECAAESGLFLSDQWTATPKSHRMIHSMPHFSLALWTSTPSAESIIQFVCVDYGSLLGRLPGGLHGCHLCWGQKGTRWYNVDILQSSGWGAWCLATMVRREQQCSLRGNWNSISFLEWYVLWCEGIFGMGAEFAKVVILKMA